MPWANKKLGRSDEGVGRKGIAYSQPQTFFTKLFSSMNEVQLD